MKTAATITAEARKMLEDDLDVRTTAAEAALTCIMASWDDTVSPEELLQDITDVIEELQRVHDRLAE